MRISDWSSDVCSSDLQAVGAGDLEIPFRELPFVFEEYVAVADARHVADGVGEAQVVHIVDILDIHGEAFEPVGQFARDGLAVIAVHLLEIRSEETTSELQSLLSIAYVVF